MKTFFRVIAALVSTYCILIAVLSFLYLFVPPVSTLMLARWVTLQPVSYAPVPLGRVSPYLVRMVLRAEDSRFCAHHGIDWRSMMQAIERSGSGGPKRGASTIPMQVTKNLFLWPQQSYLRKAIELPIAMFLNALWPKSRMLEIYLSIAEWGDGIYGAEAAAKKYFNKNASNLSQQEAALMAAALPNPKLRNPNRPTIYHAQYARDLLRSADASIDTSCLR